MNCRDAILLSEDESLSGYRRFRVKLHVFICLPCRRYLKFAQFLKASIQSTIGEVAAKITDRQLKRLGGELNRD